MEYYKNKGLAPIVYEDEGVLKEEIWRDIPNFSEYQVSDLGRVKSKNRVRCNVLGINYKTNSKIITQCFNRKGYLYFALKRDDKNFKSFRTHRLVMEVFEGKCNLTVDHVNGIKWDNRFKNLRYCTNRENSHFYRQKTKTSTNIIGVRLSGNKYSAQISISKQSYYLGSFLTKEEAQDKYNEALYNWEVLKMTPSPIEKKYSSAHKGVTYIKRTQRWCTRLTINGKRYHVGYYKEESEAIKAQIEAERNWIEFKQYPPKATFTSKYKGVYWCNKSERWKTFIRIKGNSTQIGTSKTEEEAYQKLLEYKKNNNLL